MLTLFFRSMIIDLKNLGKKAKANEVEIKKLSALTYECK